MEEMETAVGEARRTGVWGEKGRDYEPIGWLWTLRVSRVRLRVYRVSEVRGRESESLPGSKYDCSVLCSPLETSMINSESQIGSQSYGLRVRPTEKERERERERDKERERFMRNFNSRGFAQCIVCVTVWTSLSTHYRLRS
jgi:hypothetical protein